MKAKGPSAFGLGMALALLATPAAADTRWLACKFTDGRGGPQSFSMMFDEDRNIAAIFENGAMVDGTSTYITYQAIRTRFPTYVITYNRNDGVLSLSPLGGGAFTSGILTGECRRSPPPPGAPRV